MLRQFLTRQLRQPLGQSRTSRFEPRKAQYIALQEEPALLTKQAERIVETPARGREFDHRSFALAMER